MEDKYEIIMADNSWNLFQDTEQLCFITAPANSCQFAQHGKEVIKAKDSLP